MSFHDIPSAKTDGGNTETNPLTLSLLDFSDMDSTANFTGAVSSTKTCTQRHPRKDWVLFNSLTLTTVMNSISS